MDNQTLCNLVSSPLPLSFWRNRLLHSLILTRHTGLVISCILVKLLSQGHCTCCSLWMERLAKITCKAYSPHLCQVFTQISTTFSVRSFLHPPPIYTHIRHSLSSPFLFSCVCLCVKLYIMEIFKHKVQRT